MGVYIFKRMLDHENEEPEAFDKEMVSPEYDSYFLESEEPKSNNRFMIDIFNLLSIISIGILYIGMGVSSDTARPAWAVDGMILFSIYLSLAILSYNIFRQLLWRLCNLMFVLFSCLAFGKLGSVVVSIMTYPETLSYIMAACSCISCLSLVPILAIAIKSNPQIPSRLLSFITFGLFIGLAMSAVPTLTVVNSMGSTFVGYLQFTVPGFIFVICLIWDIYRQSQHRFNFDTSKLKEKLKKLPKVNLPLKGFKITSKWLRREKKNDEERNEESSDTASIKQLDDPPAEEVNPEQIKEEEKNEEKTKEEEKKVEKNETLSLFSSQLHFIAFILAIGNSIAYGSNTYLTNLGLPTSSLMGWLGSVIGYTFTCIYIIWSYMNQDFTSPPQLERSPVKEEAVVEGTKEEEQDLKKESSSILTLDSLEDDKPEPSTEAPIVTMNDLVQESTRTLEPVIEEKPDHDITEPRVAPVEFANRGEDIPDILELAEKEDDEIENEQETQPAVEEKKGPVALPPLKTKVVLDPIQPKGGDGIKMEQANPDEPVPESEEVPTQGKRRRSQSASGKMKDVILKSAVEFQSDLKDLKKSFMAGASSLAKHFTLKSKTEKIKKDAIKQVALLQSKSSENLDKLTNEEVKVTEPPVEEAVQLVQELQNKAESEEIDDIQEIKVE